MKKIKVEVEVSDEVHGLIERIASFLGVTPESLVKDRYLSNLRNLPEDFEPYLEKEVQLLDS